MQVCYYPAAPPFHVMAVFSGTRVMRVLLCVVIVAPCCVAACVCVGVAAEFARLRLTVPSRSSNKRFSFLMMPNV